MFLTIQLIIAFLCFKSIQPMDIFKEPNRDQRAENLLTLGKVVQFIVESKINRAGRRAVEPGRLAKAQSLDKILSKNMSPIEFKKWLRQHTKSIPEMRRRGVYAEHSNLIEKELKNALSHKKSALYDKPYLSAQGRHDYLVMQSDTLDPFVTVVPNSMYYNIEKKCVNWLDDCSLQGIRASLLHRVQSPYK